MPKLSDATVLRQKAVEFQDAAKTLFRAANLLDQGRQHAPKRRKKRKAKKA